jgi:hypothetical protein
VERTNEHAAICRRSLRLSEAIGQTYCSLPQVFSFEDRIRDTGMDVALGPSPMGSRKWRRSGRAGIPQNAADFMLRVHLSDGADRSDARGDSPETARRQHRTGVRERQARGGMIRGRGSCGDRMWGDVAGWESGDIRGRCVVRRCWDMRAGGPDSVSGSA